MLFVSGPTRQEASKFRVMFGDTLLSRRTDTADCFTLDVHGEQQTDSPAVADEEPLVRRSLEQSCSMLTMTTPDVEILAVRLFTVGLQCILYMAPTSAVQKNEEFEGIWSV